MKSRKFKALVILLAPLASLGVLEVGFRIRAHHSNQETLSAAFSRQPEASPDGRVRFYDIIRPDQNERIIYSLRPGLDTEFKGAPIQTNRLGLRGPEVEPGPVADTVTILCAGGSNMFGHGVGNADLWTVELQRLLEERYPECGWRVINTAVPSYNVVMKVETIRAVGLQFEPDFVILQVASNNLELPGYIRVEKDPLGMGQSFLLGFFREREYALAVLTGDLGWHRRSPPETIPEEYRGLVGWDPFHAALDDLAALSEREGFEVLCFANLALRPTKRMLNQAGRRGFHSICFVDDVADELDAQLGEGGYTDQRFLDSDLIVGPTNSHPSARLHALDARWVLREMEQRGVIERLLAARR